jgi:hypothetical protein
VKLLSNRKETLIKEITSLFVKDYSCSFRIYIPNLFLKIFNHNIRIYELSIEKQYNKYTIDILNIVFSYYDNNDICYYLKFDTELFLYNILSSFSMMDLFYIKISFINFITY